MSLFSENSSFVDSLDVSGVSVPAFDFLLGKNAKSTAMHERRDFQAPQKLVIHKKGSKKYDDNPTAKENRLERFKLQSAVAQLLPNSRTAKCLRLRKKSLTDVSVYRSVKHGSTSYKGLQTCGSVWTCPVCAAKVSECRRKEVLHAITTHESNGGDVFLLTLTNPHTKTDDLNAMTKAQSKAMSRFTGCRAVRSIYKDIGYIGGIRAWEVTHGYFNGWHPHFHILLFVGKGADTEDLQNKLYEQWANACVLSGLDKPSMEHGVRVDKGDKAAKYVVKWGLDHEVTKGHTEKVKGKGRSPFDLLRFYSDNQDEYSGALFVEFSKVFKGKRQLYWSSGLKEMFDIENLDDGKESDDEDELVGTLKFHQWKLVLKYEKRGEVLELARNSWESVMDLLDYLLIKNENST